MGSRAVSADRASAFNPGELIRDKSSYPHAPDGNTIAMAIARQTNTFKGFVITVPSLLN
jgi:hypothetical protein